MNADIGAAMRFTKKTETQIDHSFGKPQRPTQRGQAPGQVLLDALDKWHDSGRDAVPTGSCRTGSEPGPPGVWAAWLDDAYLKPLPKKMVKHRIQRDPVNPTS